MDSETELKLISLFSELTFLVGKLRSNFVSILYEIIGILGSMDLDSQPRPETEIMSLTTQIVTLFKSMDFHSQPKPLLNLISIISPESVPESEPSDSDSKPGYVSESYFMSVLEQTLCLKPEPEFVYVINQILSLVKWGKLISLCPQLQVTFRQGKFHVTGNIPHKTCNIWLCLSLRFEKIGLSEQGATHFFCRGCNGHGHERYEKAPLEIKHPLHPKHTLQLVLLTSDTGTRECYCCFEDLDMVFYYCSACDFSINVACADRQPVLTTHHPKLHDHTLHWFPRLSPLTCNLCSLPGSDSSIYMCPPCDLVFHQKCIYLPRVIKISRHLHRISLTFSFDKGDWSCGVCRIKIDNDYGGYSCIKDGCSYVAHSKCATQSNLWDGIDLEGVPEENEEEVVEPFVRISDGVIQHFSHQQHHLRLDEDTCRDYDEDKLCQACVMPIYSDNLYSCKECDFVIHEACANLSRKIHHPIHPHPLTLALVEGNQEIAKDEDTCSATCPWFFTSGFVYKCGREECSFNLHVTCATINEPLVHASHMHPLYLTTKPGEYRRCSICEAGNDYKETFNCIECDYTLCFLCAYIPHKVRYKHDKHMLTLTYGNERDDITYWCEICEAKIYYKNQFYMCEEYCCITVHMTCLLGKDFYKQPGSSWLYAGREVVALPNNHMTRPHCDMCDKRCPDKLIFQSNGKLYCSGGCIHGSLFFS